MAALAGRLPARGRGRAGPRPLAAGNGRVPVRRGLPARPLASATARTTLPALARVHSGRSLPYLDELTSQKVTGAVLPRAVEHWREARVAGSVRRGGRRDRTPAGSPRRTALTDARRAPVGPALQPRRRVDRLHEPHAHALPRDPPDAARRRRATGGWSCATAAAPLAWTPDGRPLVYDEPEIYRTFSACYDLRVVDVASGRRRALTRGQRAREPDVGPDGATVVFVRQDADRSELAIVDLSRAGPRAT